MLSASPHPSGALMGVVRGAWREYSDAGSHSPGQWRVEEQAEQLGVDEHH